MINDTIHNEELPLQPIKPKLTMKYLQDQLGEMKDENLRLAGRVSELEQKLENLCRIQIETAADAEMTSRERQETLEEEISKPIFNNRELTPISRIKRHQTDKKPGFWAGLLRSTF